MSSAFNKLKQEDHQFQTSLSYAVNLRPAWVAQQLPVLPPISSLSTVDTTSTKHQLLLTRFLT